MNNTSSFSNAAENALKGLFLYVFRAKNTVGKIWEIE